MYKIGTRVKKVQGLNLGITGVVCSGPAINEFTLSDARHGEDMYVRIDQPWKNPTGNSFPACTVAVTISANWEPIIPDGSNIPATESIKQLMEKYCHV